MKIKDPKMILISILDICLDTAIKVAVGTVVFVSICQAMGFYFA